MAQYDLTGNNDASFKFSIRDNVYEFAYPTTGDMKELIAKFRQLEATDDKKEQEKLAKALDEQLRSYITPIDHEVSINDALDAESVQTVRNFNKMVRTEIFNY